MSIISKVAIIAIIVVISILCYMILYGGIISSESLHILSGNRGTSILKGWYVQEILDNGKVAVTYEIGYDISELMAKGLTIGRSKDCDIALKGNTISSVHGRIKKDANGSLFIRDENSLNGIYEEVNRQMEKRSKVMIPNSGVKEIYMADKCLKFIWFDTNTAGYVKGRTVQLGTTPQAGSFQKTKRRWR